jgi:hypothetical protein
MNCKPTSAVLSSIERTDRLLAAEAAQPPTSSQTVKKDWGKASRKANAKFQLGPSEISAQSCLQENQEKNRLY